MNAAEKFPRGVEVSSPPYQRVEVPSPPYQGLQPRPIQYRAYKGRFYVLVVTSMLAALQNIAWLTFGPITQQAKDAYGLTDAELTLLPSK